MLLFRQKTFQFCTPRLKTGQPVLPYRELELFKIFQMSFSNRMLFMKIRHLSCSPDPTADSETANPIFHEFFGQKICESCFFICDLIDYRIRENSGVIDSELVVARVFPKYVVLIFCDLMI